MKLPSCNRHQVDNFHLLSLSMMGQEAGAVNDAHSSENTGRLERLLAVDHAELDALLRALNDALAGNDAMAAFARLDLFWARLAVHIRAEHLHVFPAILAATVDEADRSEQLRALLGATRADIAQLRSDHDFFMHELARAVKTMRELLARPGSHNVTSRLQDVRQLLLTVTERLVAHNRLEEERVYRLPAVILGTSEQSALAVEVERELRNVPPRFSRCGDGKP
jgi:hypothetical protein